VTTIVSVEANWVLDSRSSPTVEATVTLADGRSSFAQAPSGASTGSHESWERRDGDPDRFGGRGVSGAVDVVRDEVSSALSGMDVTDQAAVDRALVDLDGTENRSRLGANTMVAVSAACARAGAMARGVALWEHLAGERRPSLPLPMVNLFSGNLHASGGMSIQDVLIVPFGAGDESTAIEWAHDIYCAARAILAERGASTLVGDEGGFGAPSPSSEAAIALAVEAIVRARRAPGEEVAIALDVAATHMLQHDGSYLLDGNALSADDLVETFVAWADRFPIVSIEDPLGEDDWTGWGRAAARLDPTVQLLGDDLICTHVDRLERAAALGCANAVLVKANQIGTLTEALAVADRARALGMRAVVSARSGETEDDWLSDLAVASGAGQIKVGSVARSERLAKYNRLLRIARGHGAPPWSGANGFDRALGPQG
jgi:enolase